MQTGDSDWHRIGIGVFWGAFFEIGAYFGQDSQTLRGVYVHATSVKHVLWRLTPGAPMLEFCSTNSKTPGVRFGRQSPAFCGTYLCCTGTFYALPARLSNARISS